MAIRASILLAVLPLLVQAQTPAPTTPATPTLPPTVQSSALPSYLVSTGVAWNRFSGVPFSNTTSLGIRISSTNIYSWSTLDTPVTVPSIGQPPQLSSIRTGAAYVFAQSATAGISAFALGDIGLATSPAATLAQYSGGVGVAWRIKKSGFFVMPMYRVISVPATTSTPSGVQTLPEIQLGYAFGLKN